MAEKIKKELILDGLCCANCAAKIEGKVKGIEGVDSAIMNFINKTLTIETESPHLLEDIIKETTDIVVRIEPHVVVREKNITKVEKKVLILMGLGCANCAAKMEKEIRNIHGVKSASVDFATQKLTMEITSKRDEERILKEVETIVKKIEGHVNVVSEESTRKKTDENIEDEEPSEVKRELLKLAVGGVIFTTAIILNLSYWAKFAVFFTAYIIVGGEVLLKAGRNIIRGQVFDENFLMALATVGAFATGQFPEGVAVMLFYQLGELFQDFAVDRSRKSIASLMNIRPDFAVLKLGNEERKVEPEEVKIGDIIIVRPGEKIPLDGTVLEGNSMLDTSALTGESVPREASPGSSVLGGCINKNGVLTVEVAKEFGQSTVAKILDLVQNASSKKAPTESFITKFARYYTPTVVIGALLLAFLPPIFIADAQLSHWVYRALVFLVVSCPCALVVSIPLGFFGGIGGASKNGILIKGGNYLEALNNVETVVFDKTGTLTKGVFNVTEILPNSGVSNEALLEYAAYAESYSNHPIATSISRAYGKDIDKEKIQNYEEISGEGIRVNLGGREVLAGNTRLMDQENIRYNAVDAVGTFVYIAVDKEYAGCIVISDEIKEDSAKAVKALKELGIKKTIMLTGDMEAVGSKVGKALSIDEVYSELLPQDKVMKLEEIESKKGKKGKLIFVGDGINDAPVLARADIGIAMGGVGSDAAIEAADVVIMTDEPSKIAAAIKIAKKTKSIVMQNIVFALGVKIVILILGAFGIATMWEAVFGDVGVALIAVMNAMRAMRVEKS